MANATTPADSVEIKRAKWAQTLTNQARSQTASSEVDLVSLVLKNLTFVFVCLSLVPVHRPSCQAESSFHSRIGHSNHGPCQENESSLQ